MVKVSQMYPSEDHCRPNAIRQDFSPKIILRASWNGKKERIYLLVLVTTAETVMFWKDVAVTYAVETKVVG